MYTRIRIRSILLIGFALFAKVVCAQSIRVQLVNSHEVYFAFSDLPVLTHKDGFARIETTSAIVEYPIDEILSISKCGTTTAIDSSAKTKGLINKEDSRIYFTGFMPSCIGHLYNINGTIIDNFGVSTDGSTSVDISSYPSGIYVVNIEGCTFKIENK